MDTAPQSNETFRHPGRHPDIPRPSLIRKIIDAVYDVVTNRIQQLLNAHGNKEALLQSGHYNTERDLIRSKAEPLTVALSRELIAKSIEGKRGILSIETKSCEALVERAIAAWVADTRTDIYRFALSELTMPEIPGLEETVRELLDANRESRHRDRSNTLLIQTGSVVRNRAVNLRAERIANPETAEEDAKELTARHQRLRRTEEIANVMLNLWTARNYLERAGSADKLRATLQLQEAEKGYDELARKVETLGTFLEFYTVDKIKERILQPNNWVIFRSHGHPIIEKKDSQGEKYLEIGQPVYGGDIQIHVPDNRLNAEIYFELPDFARGDKFQDAEGREIAQKILQNPSIAGCVSDFCADDAVQRQAFASQPRVEAFTFIKRHFPHVQYLIAELVTIKGLRLLNGPEFRPRPIPNSATWDAHRKTNQARFSCFGWTRTDRLVDVYNEKDMPVCQLIVDWDAVIHKLYPSKY